MDAVIRKRITKVGSGAWSVYLPKKWIDAWIPEQQEGREIDLRYVSQSILITPVLQQEQFDKTCPAAAVPGLLQSAYIRGYNVVRLTPASDDFDADTVATARDLLRHLDERLVADCRPEGIGFTLRSDLPAPAQSGHEVLAVLGAKTTEVLRLARDAIESHGHDLQRTLHAARLLRDTHAEDVDRLFHQAARLVATLEIPLESVSDYQLLGLTAAELHRTSEQALRIGDTVLADMGFTQRDLDYPREYLIEHAKPVAPPTGVAHEMVKACRRGFDALDEVLQTTLAAMAHADVQGLQQTAQTAKEAGDTLQARVLGAVADHWGSRTAQDAALAAFTASKHATALQNALGHIESVCRHAMGLLAARPHA